MRLALVAALAMAAAAQQPAQTGAIEEQSLRQLLTVRRVYVDRLGGGETAAQMRDMIIASLQSARLFLVTENQERHPQGLRRRPGFYRTALVERKSQRARLRRHYPQHAVYWSLRQRGRRRE